MTITFQSFAAGNHPAIRQTPDRVVGFMVQFNDPQYGTPTEVLYALTDDGRCYETNPLPRPNPSFDKIGRTWHLVDSIPDHAEYIGTYHVPPSMLR